MKLLSYPKIFTVGDRHTLNLFDDPVQVTEKVDGSQFRFGRIDGELCIGSKGARIYVEQIPKLFFLAVNYVLSIQDILPDNIMFFGETLSKPKHNTLEYGRVPLNYISLFAALNKDGSIVPPDQVKNWASVLNVDHVPVIWEGYLNKPILEKIHAFLDRESYLGKASIEGVVVKNFNKEGMGGNIIFPLLQGKYVSEKFKEIHIKSWPAGTGKGKWEDYKEGFRTEARWLKSIQHLKDKEELSNSPKDIGPILKELARDITEEERENIKEYLWNTFGKDVIRAAQRGFPEFYKEYLVKEQYGTKEKV